MAEIFNQIDADGDGFLDQSEVQGYENTLHLLDEWNDFVAFDEDGMLLNWFRENKLYWR